MLNYVDEHLSDELSLQRLSAQFHLNYTYCSELFRAITGATFTKYLSSHRMERARTLIITTPMSISEIARQTGYSNYNHFSATFKHISGRRRARTAQRIRKGVCADLCASISVLCAAR